VPKTRAQLRNLLRAKLAAWPEAVTTISAQISSTTANTITVASATGLSERQLLVIDSEVLQVVSISSLTVTVIRGARGTTAATHTNGSTVTAYAPWGWTDSELNDEIDSAVRWLSPEVWVPETHENTVNAQALEFGLPTAWSYPDQVHLYQVELALDNGDYRPVYCWRQDADRLVFDRRMDRARAIRLTGKGKQPTLTADATQLEHDDYAEAIIYRAAKGAQESLLANRIRFVDYSATLNDRASVADEIQRAITYFGNQADREKDRCHHPTPAMFASARRV
jgi:hypothetical protein